ncbi:hypothetical protein [Vibrio barjaei]|uniref:hypothetical protein n=1 Tax=Vibrio barjaei TaxID=1676683 RepID=UPI0022849077|nr:hypothetical protein [Vibrio barjaei]MCY9872952.1 hypothetical protein [Vibrio barjaei]
MDICEKCNSLIFPNFTGRDHQCEEFIIITEDGEEHSQYGSSVDVAIGKFAESYSEENENHLLDNPETITVNGEKYKISAEATIIYRSEPL